MTDTNTDISDSINKINKLYDNLTYFDLYGSSVLSFIIINIVIFLIYSYSIVMINSSAIKADWINQRCNPKVIPFAGFIYKPDDKSAIDFTGDNFNFCIQGILQKITGFAVQPFNFLIEFLSKIFDEINKAINFIRTFFSRLRTKFSDIAENILSRILNMLIPMQQIVIALQDSFSKTNAILTSGLYTALGSYYTLQAFLGGIVNLIIKILIALAATIIGLWIVPFTRPFAISMTIIFISVAIPLTIIIIFMSQMLHIKPSLGIPGIPRCFDKNTKIKMLDGSYKIIKNIQIGDILFNNNKVTTKIKLSAKDCCMYDINGVIVSDSHRVKYNNKWIYVKDYPDKKPISNYLEPYLYCLNTTTKEIFINNLIFCDWDELYGDNLEKILNTNISSKNEKDSYINESNKIHHYLDNGFPKDTCCSLSNGKHIFIQDIKIGDMLSNDDIVYGVVEIDAIDLFNKPNNYLGPNKFLVDCSCDKLYHLLTYSGKFYINSELFYDYNSLIDLNLSK